MPGNILIALFVAIFFLERSKARELPGDEVSSGVGDIWLNTARFSRKGTPRSYENMFRPMGNAAFRRKRHSRRRLCISDWERMGRLERFLHEKRRTAIDFLDVEYDFAGDSNFEREWKALQRAMKLSYVEDECATVFSVEDDDWVSCCLLENKCTTETVGFCGSHEVLGLPVPCRAPEQGFDYESTMGLDVRTTPKPPDASNIGDWSCNEVQSKEHKTGRNEKYTSADLSRGRRRRRRRQRRRRPRQSRIDTGLIDNFSHNVNQTKKRNDLVENDTLRRTKSHDGARSFSSPPSARHSHLHPTTMRHTWRALAEAHKASHARAQFVHVNSSANRQSISSGYRGVADVQGSIKEASPMDNGEQPLEFNDIFFAVYEVSRHPCGYKDMQYMPCYAAW